MPLNFCIQFQMIGWSITGKHGIDVGIQDVKLVFLSWRIQRLISLSS